MFETRNRPNLAQRPGLGENYLLEQRGAPAFAQVNGLEDLEFLPSRDVVPADLSQAETLCLEGRILLLGLGVFSQAGTLRMQVPPEPGRCTWAAALCFSNARRFLPRREIVQFDLSQAGTVRFSCVLRARR